MEFDIRVGTDVRLRFCLGDFLVEKFPKVRVGFAHAYLKMHHIFQHFNCNRESAA